MSMKMEWKLVLPPTLAQVAFVKIAQEFWKIPEITNRVKSMFTKTSDTVFYENTKSFSKQKPLLYSTIYKEVNKLYVPKIINCELKIYIEILGENMFTLLGYVSRILEKGDKNFNEQMESYIDAICWSNSGAVDEPETFRRFYSNKLMEIDYFMGICAKNLCLEELILSWQPRSSKSADCRESLQLIFEDEYLKDYPEMYNNPYFWMSHFEILNDGYSNHLLMYWKLWKLRDQTPEDWSKFIMFLSYTTSSDYYKIYDEHHSIEENMFRLSVVQGNLTSVKYFWNKLNNEEKNRKLVTMASIVSWSQFEGAHENSMKRGGKQFTDVLVFLLQQMSSDQLDELLNNNMESEIVKLPMYSNLNKRFERLHVILMLLKGMWNDLFLPIVERAWRYFDEFEFNILVVKILYHSIYNAHRTDIYENCYYFFHNFWRETPAPVKMYINLDNWLHLHKLMNKDYVMVLKCIINDTDLSERRAELLNSVQRQCTELIFDDNYELLDCFMENVLLHPEERMYFKGEIKCNEICKVFVNRGRYDAIDKLLEWYYGTQTEISKFKENFNIIPVCRTLKNRRRRDLINKLLKWYFDSNDEILKFKRAFLRKKYRLRQAA